MRRAKLGVASVTLSMLFSSGAALAQEAVPSAPAHEATPDASAPRRAEAEQHRLRALSFYDSGDYAAARSEFAHANQLMPTFRLLYNLGVVSLNLADPAGAYDYFERYLAEGGELVPADKRVEVLGQLHDLVTHIATVSVLVGTPGAEILIDDISLGNAPLGRAAHVNPGTRKISARLADGRATTRTVDLAAGSSKRIELRIPLPPPTLVSVETPRTPIFWPGWAGTAVLSAGATFAGIEALSAQRDYNHHLDIITSRAELDRLDTRATRWSVTADTLGAAAVVVGVWSLYLTLRHAPTHSDDTKSAGNFSIQLLSNQVKADLSF